MRNLWQHCRDEPAVNANGGNVDFNEADATTNSFKIKEKKTGETDNDDTKSVEISIKITIKLPLKIKVKSRCNIFNN